MPVNTEPRAPATNRLLAALPKKEHQRLLPELEQVTMPFAEALYEPGAQIRHVYFPNDSIVSLLAQVADRSTLEVGFVGNEGMAGISVFMGVDTSPHRAIVQGAGTAMRMEASVLRKESDGTGALHRLLHLYAHSLLTQVSRTAACNRFHMVDARLARWLLMSGDRLGSDEFLLTQEFISNMLGVRREGVSKSAGILQKHELINYSRGRIKILDRAGLEATACECYGILKAESDGYLSKG
ncbi:MAG TPA: Crp/Fnr family transcriptional regulator [Pyrinomonadaceae bacterium]|nr:Crp/Fnr family transcriptional regulator [Pyrinomonadaceae bacterium]